MIGMKYKMKKDKETPKKPSKKLDFNLNDINGFEDDEIEFEKKVIHSKDYAKTLLWLSFQFFEEGESYVTNKQLSKFLKKVPQNTIQIMEVFVMHNVLGNFKRGKFKAILYHLKNTELLKKLIPTAKKTIGIDDKSQKKLK